MLPEFCPGIVWLSFGFRLALSGLVRAIHLSGGDHLAQRFRFSALAATEIML